MKIPPRVAVGCILLLGHVIVHFFSHYFRPNAAAAVDKAACLTHHTYSNAPTPSRRAALAAKWAQHPQPAERHENSHESSAKAERN